MTWFRKPGGSTMNLSALMRFAFVASLATAASFSAAQDRLVTLPLVSNRVDPKAFGIQDETVTTISAFSFSPAAGTGGAGDCPHFLPGPSLYANCSIINPDVHYFTTLDLPAGAVIDLIGVNTATPTDGIMGAALWQRNRDGSKTMLTGFSLPAHDWATDYAPVGILVDTHRDREYLLEVERASPSNHPYFGWVEVWWHRSVSPPPPTPTFGDVPTTDLGYQYVQALVASGITGGCGGGNFCPDSNLTRRQMAIFLAKALGLHWPN